MQEHHSNANEEHFFEDRGFGVMMGFGKRPAVIVIDIIRAFTDYKNPEMLLAANLDKEIEENKRIIKAARDSKIPIIYTTTAYDDENLRDAGTWALKQKGLFTLKAGTPQVELDPALDFQKGDILLTKKYASAFFSTDLSALLVSQGIDTIIITGCTTSGCVRATTVDGTSSGFRTAVVREAVGDRSQAAHEQSLFDLQAKYADVVSTEEVLNYFKSIK